MLDSAAKVDEEKKVAILDLTNLRHPDAEVRIALGKEIAKVCEEVGFFYIVNHGIAPAMMQKMFEIGREYFELPLEQKMELSMANAKDYRGYLPMKMLGNDPEMKGNLLESFHVWQENAANDPYVLAGKPLHGQNRWPQQVLGMREEVLAYTEAVTALARDMIKVVALGLGLQEDAFAKFFDKPMSLLRFIHYPPQDPSVSDGRFGTRPHTDNGAFTLLAQDDTGGLEILGSDGEWMTVPPVPNSFVVNLGEMMKVWTNGLFRATPHRVINRYGKERYSVPFFLNASYDVLITPILRERAMESEPLFHTTVARDQPTSCGEILMRLYHRIWPSSNEQQLN